MLQQAAALDGTAHEVGPGASPGAEAASSKAEVLLEALPYIRRFWGKVVVVKYGGGALAGGEGEAANLKGLAADIVLMRSVGMRLVVVHGGGPQIGELMGRLGKTPEFKDGLRVTDAETLEIVRMVMVGKVNRDLVGAINTHGPLAVGVSGEDGGLLQVSPKDPALGFVGEVSRVNPELLERLVSENLVPVVATIGSDENGQSYNVNADTAAAAIAQALGAEKLVFLSDVEGIRADRADPASLMTQLTLSQLDAAIGDATVVAGMVPKARAAADAVRGGVPQAHILDGRVPHVLLLEFFTRSGIGTMVLP